MKETKPVTVPQKVPNDNKAEGSKVSVGLDTLKFSPVHKKQPAARWGTPFCLQGILHVDTRKIQKTSESADKIKEPDVLEGSEAVEVEESTSYEDWLRDQGLMNSSETTDFELKVQVEDITDNENSGDEGSSKETEENSEVKKCDGKTEDSKNEETKKLKEDKVDDVKPLDSIKFKVQDLIDKGESEENSEVRIKRLEMILSLLNEEDKDNGEKSDKICDASKPKMEEVKDEKEVKTPKEVPIHKIEKEEGIKVLPEKSNDEKVVNKLQDVEKGDESVVKDGKMVFSGGKGKSPVKVHKSPETMSEAVLSICKIDKGDGKCNRDKKKVDKVAETMKSDVEKGNDSVVQDGKMVVSGGNGKSPVKVHKSPEKMSEAVLSFCKIVKGDGMCNTYSIVDTGTHITKYEINKADIQTDGCDNHNDETLSHETDVPIHKIEEEPDGAVSSSGSSVSSMDTDMCIKNEKTRRVSFVLSKDKEENLDTSTDTAGDFVIDMDRCDTTQDTIDTESTVNTVQNNKTEDTEETVELKEDSSDIVDVDDIDLPDDDDDEPFPLSQNVH